MKKLLSILLITVLVMAGGTAAFAADDTSAALQGKSDRYFSWNCWENDSTGEFAEGEDPNADIVYGFLFWESGALEPYSVVDDNIMYKIPAEDYYALAAQHFTVTDTLKEELKTACMFFDSRPGYIDGYFYYYHGGAGDITPEYYYKGYEALGNNTYAAYGYEVFLLGDPEVVDGGLNFYKPAPDDIEGVDYVITKNYGTDGDGLAFTECSAKRILSTVVTTFKFDGSNYITTSFQAKDKSAMPSDNRLSGTGSDSTPDEDIIIDFNPSVFESEAMVYCIEETSDTVKTNVKEALGETADNFIVFNAFAKDYSGNLIQPKDGVVEITFKVPEDFSDNVAVYFIDDNGNTEKVDSVYDAATNTVIAKLTHFSTYALVDLGDNTTNPGGGDNIGPGNTDNTPGGNTAPGNNAGAPATQTGDSTDMTLYFALMLIAVMGISGAMFFRRSGSAK